MSLSPISPTGASPLCVSLRLVSVVVLFAACAASRASTITFDKQSGTSFEYDLTVQDYLDLEKGSTITFTGLNSVFGAGEGGNFTNTPLFIPTFTSTKVTFTTNPPFGDD